jgi:hypothetical protein
MSQIMVLDPDTMSLEVFKSFGEYRGSLTWAVHDEQHWWCTFAHYGETNYQTVLVKLDDQWNERGIWSFPSEVVKDLRKASISGGLWYQGQLLATGHDRRVIYRLRLPTCSNLSMCCRRRSQDKVSPPIRQPAASSELTGQRVRLSLPSCANRHLSSVPRSPTPQIQPIQCRNARGIVYNCSGQRC